MSSTTRYQVFLSSTFTDLKEERAEVIQALWELDCIPTGMEAFLASNISQWDVIQRVIDECDYYILIIGGRYGTLTDEGISYTEKEFDYARKIGLPVMAFVHASPEKIEVQKTESSENLRLKLDAFRAKVMDSYPVRTWTTPHELGGIASRSLIQEIKRTPRPGWIRNDGGSPVELLKRIDQLTLQNAELTAKLNSKSGPVLPVEELASGRDITKLSGTFTTITPGDYRKETHKWDVNVTWDEIFANIGPFLINEANESAIEKELLQFFKKANIDPSDKNIRTTHLASSSYNDVIVQLRALGLIQVGQKKRGVNDQGNYWALTQAGDDYLVSLRARRKDGSKILDLHDDDEDHADEKEVENAT